VAKALAERKWTVSSARLIWKAKNPVTVDDEAKRAEVEAFLEALDGDDDVQRSSSASPERGLTAPVTTAVHAA
jgi:transcriptional/translational regulatory protein YebC/TACO1